MIFVALCGAPWWDQSSADCTPVAEHHIMEWMGAIVMTCNLDSILLSDTTVRDSSSTSTSLLALQITLFSLLASATLSLPPQHTTAWKIAQIFTYDSTHIFCMTVHVLCYMLHKVMKMRLENEKHSIIKIHKGDNRLIILSQVSYTIIFTVSCFVTSSKILHQRVSTSACILGERKWAVVAAPPKHITVGSLGVVSSICVKRLTEVLCSFRQNVP